VKILQVNKFCHILGGTDRYFFEVSKLLKYKKHRIEFFTASKKTFVNIIFNLNAYRKIDKILSIFPADIVHLHSIYHHLTPFMLLTIRNKNIPAVQTIEDYHIISPNYNLFHNGKICEITKPNKFYKAIFHKCVKNSYLFSLAEVIEKYIHYWLGWERNYIDYFIAPSLFMKKKLTEYGLPKTKIVHLPHFVDYKAYKPNYENGNYILYFGRLSPEKGINYLIEAMKLLPKVKLLIVGRGSQKQELRRKNQELGNKNVEFVGFQEGTKLKKLIAQSKFTVLPAVWYEVFGLSILESFACGKPVIASDIGGIPEIVKDGLNGLLVKPGNIDDLAEKIDKLWNNTKLYRELGKNAREYAEKNFGPEEHYVKLMSIYKMAIDKKNNP